MGIHLFLGYALGATDLHGENIIAHGEYPVIIDMETYPGYLKQQSEKDGSSVEEKTLNIPSFFYHLFHLAIFQKIPI